MEVELSSSEDDSLPTEDHPDPAPAAEKPGSYCRLLNSIASKKETPEAHNNPPEAAPHLPNTEAESRKVDGLVR